ncbi:MAG: helix-turn-helix transcriptional regulator [Candidatus Gastranaerophilaceae bacterium]
MQQINKENEKNIIIALGKITKELREKRNLSLNIFSFENDLQKSLVSRIENGKNEPKLISLWKISEGLEIKLSELIGLLEENLGEDFKLNY